MSNFINKVEGIVVKMLAVLLILLVSTQIMFREEGGRNILKGVEGYLQQHLSQPVVLDGEYGYIQMKLESGGLPQIKVLINNRIVDDFQHYRVRVYVREGDYLAIDGGEIKGFVILTFEQVSRPIKNIEPGNIIVIDGGRKELGRIIFDSKI